VVIRVAPVSGDEGDRTLNPRLAKAVLSQLSYVPVGRFWMPAAISNNRPFLGDQ
jgi:hypothetical protein